MRLSRNHWLLLLFVVLVILAGVAGLRRPVSPAPARQAAAPAPVVLPDVVEPGPSLPLPLPGQPFGEIQASLRERADAGDRAAACRLGVELLACERMERMGERLQEHFTQLERMQADRGQLEGADRTATTHLGLLQRREQCALRSPDLAGAGFRYLRQAALAGDRDAVLIYTGGHMFQDYSHLQDNRFDTWRREAAALVQREFRNGNTDMVFQLVAAHGNDDGPGSGLFKDDPVMAQAYEFLQLALFGRPMVPGAYALADADQARAKALARRWHAEYFDSQVHAPDAGIYERSLVPLTFMSLTMGRAVTLCGPPATSGG